MEKIDKYIEQTQKEISSLDGETENQVRSLFSKWEKHFESIGKNAGNYSLLAFKEDVKAFLGNGDKVRDKDGKPLWMHRGLSSKDKKFKELYTWPLEST